MITGATRVAGVIGDPVRHSLSPALHNAAYEALGLDWVFLAFEVPDGGASAALDAARALGFVGLAVTMPHKAAIASLCDERSAGADDLRSVNTVTFSAGGHATGESTDGDGFLRSLAAADVDVSGCSVLVLGAGGAARAVARALAVAGARGRGDGPSTGCRGRRGRVRARRRRRLGRPRRPRPARPTSW